MTTSFEAANDAFLAELRSHGAVVSDVIAVADYTAEHAGRGIVANADIAPETELFSLPLSACLSATTSRAAAWIPDHPELAENGWAPVITAVLYELAFRESSQWNAYFDILPASLETPLFWPESDLALLVGTDVPKRIAREESLSLYTNVILPAIEHHVADPADRARFSPDLFLYAGSLLMAYGFSVGSLTGTGHDSDDDDEEEDDMPILVPLADTLNAVHPNSAHLQRSGDTVAMVATAAVAAGTQVFNTYGDHACNELLRRYGYVEWEKRFDAVTVDAEAVVRIARAAIVGAGGWGEGMSETKVDAGIEKRVCTPLILHVFNTDKLKRIDRSTTWPTSTCTTTSTK
ncbi:hypothetical protein BC828DRAFT_348983 [Blastocladiella britannica]|nr:hypothetical protein BC828DRAFT_348983 [Blastocladiella britannica]